MRALRQLAGQTAVYGLSTVVVRLLNYLLVPFHTRVFTEQADYGIISELYAWVAFLNVIFMYGMETAFFRYASREDPGRVFRTGFTALIGSTILLSAPMLLASGGIAEWLQYPDRENYVTWFILIIALDTLSNIPFARLRHQSKPLTYAGVKLLNVVVNVGLNFFFLLPLVSSSSSVVIGLQQFIASTGFVYDPAIGVGYVFIANLAASAVTLLVLLPGALKSGLGIDGVVFGKMFRYGAPFIIAGLAGMINETIDRILLIRMLPGDLLENRGQVGIYSAAYKLSIFMTLGVQAFRMGAEPFFFKTAADAGDPAKANKIYADVLRYFVLIGSFIFVSISMLLPELRNLIIGRPYWEGVGVVPILLMANLFLGIFYNLSIWYKLTDKTSYAMLLAIFGAAITLGMNYFLIPVIGYWGSAWATLAAYAGMTLLSFVLGRRHFPIPYNLPRIVGYIGLGALLVVLVPPLETEPILPRIGVIVGYTTILLLFERKALKNRTT